MSLVLGEVYKNCPKIKKKWYFRKQTSKKVISTINQEPLTSSHDKIVIKFGQKKNGQLCFGQSVQKLFENKEIFFFYETYFEESNINRKPHIWSNDKIVTKVRRKKCASLVLGNAYVNCPKIMEKCYFMIPTSKRVLSTENHLFGPITRK